MIFPSLGVVLWVRSDVWKTNRDLCFVIQVGAPARVGLVAPIDVIVPPGNTGLDPSQTSFFQVSLTIPSFRF